MESFSKTGCLSVRAAYYAKMTCGLSPGPAVYDSKTAMGRQISSTKKSAGQVSFGSARRDIKYGANKTPAADKYTQLGSFGKQPTDKQRTAPAFGFGTDLQRPKPVPLGQRSSPGPGAYSMVSSVGRQVISSKPSSKIAKFGSSSRDDLYMKSETPAPNANSLPSAMGKQPLSTRRSPATCGFGTSIQRPMASGADKLRDPGPGKYQSQSSMGRQPISRGTGGRSAGNVTFGSSTRDDLYSINKNPGPSTYNSKSSMGTQPLSSSRSNPSVTFGAR